MTKLKRVLFHQLWILVYFMFVLPQTANALFTELGMSGSYKKSMLDSNNYQEQQSYTGSIAFYFWQSTALEFSYTNAVAFERVADSSGLSYLEKTVKIELLSTDFIFSFADRKAAFQPFLKAGATLIVKKTQNIVQEGFNITLDSIETDNKITPSAGAGLKFLITDRFAFKAGIDWWSTPVSGKSSLNDYYGRIGLTWIL